MKVSAKIIVMGLVQGVGYRYFCYRKATEYGLTGYAKNLPDDTVEVEAEGEKGLIEDFIKDLNIGPRAAKVTNVDVRYSEGLKGYTKFDTL